MWMQYKSIIYYVSNFHIARTLETRNTACSLIKLNGTVTSRFPAGSAIKEVSLLHCFTERFLTWVVKPCSAWRWVMPFQSVARKFSFWSKHSVHTQFCSLSVKRADHFGDVFINQRMLPSSHGGGPGSRPGQSMSDLWWTKWHWERIFPSSSVSPYQYIIPPSLSKLISSGECIIC
jgi:hypothetical protein